MSFHTDKKGKTLPRANAHWASFIIEPLLLPLPCYVSCSSLVLMGPLFPRYSVGECSGWKQLAANDRFQGLRRENKITRSFFTPSRLRTQVTKSLQRPSPPPPSVACQPHHFSRNGGVLRDNTDKQHLRVHVVVFCAQAEEPRNLPNPMPTPLLN